MLTKVRLVLLALLLVGGYVATPQAVIAVDVSPTAAQYEFTQNYITSIVPGSGSGLPDSFNPTAIGNALYFQSNRGLVRANESGASEIRTSTDERLYSATNFVWFQNKVYFTANDAIWSTDGNTATLAADLWPGESGDSSSSPDLLTVVGDWLYFRAAGPGTWVQLWRTNGDTVEQISFTCIGGVVCDHDPSNLTSLGEKVLFKANDGDGFNGGGYGIWSYDGATVSKIWAGPSSAWASPTRLVAQDGKFYFAALSAVGPDYLQSDLRLTIWQTDGTEAGTAALAEFPFIATEQGACSSLVLYRGALYLCAASVEYDAELWSVDIATGATNLVADLNTAQGSWPDELTAVDGKLYFTADADQSTPGRCLYEFSLESLSCITLPMPDGYASSLTEIPAGLSFLLSGKVWIYAEETLRQLVTPDVLPLSSLTWLSDSIVAGSFWHRLYGRELLVGTVSSRLEQAITFTSIPNRTTGQPLSFAVAPIAGSGLPVSLSATGACEVTGFSVSVLDKGICTLTATQEGDETWMPAEPVTRTFNISRVLLSNKTVTFLQWDGKPAVGIGVNWRTPDGTYRSNYQPLYLCTTKSKCPVTNSKGQITFAKIPGGAIDFEVTGKIGVWQTSVEASDRSQVKRAIVSSAASNVQIGPTEGDQPVLVRVRVSLPSGAPVPGASVEYGLSENQFSREDAQCTVAGLSWNLSTCVWRATTNSDGVAILRLPASTATYQGGRSMGKVHARFTDDILSQMSAAVILTENGAEIALEDLPVVDIDLESATVNLGAATVLTAIALDEGGLPIQGQKLILKSSVSGATKSCTGTKTVALTNSAGRATFKVCPIKTATWTVDGKAIVGSAGVRLTVQSTPTAPRSLAATPKTRSVALAWTAPASLNAGSVSDYVVQYRLQGSSTWITFRDGTSTARKATVTGLTSGQIYEVRVAAKNKSGTGTWSDIVLGTPN